VQLGETLTAPDHKLMPETSPEQKSNPEHLTSGNSNFESAKGSPALEPTGQGESSSPQMTGLGESSHPLIEDLVEGGPHYKQIKLIEGGPQFKTDFDPLAKSSYWTKPRPKQPPYSPIKNLFPAIKDLNQPLSLNTTTMAHLLMDQKNSTSISPKSLMVIEMASKSSCRT
jgi:hypothetical protein